jgi:uncharacterized protein (DUF2267 family)
VVRLWFVNDTQLLERLRSLTGEEDQNVLRTAVDVAGRGLGARLPNEVVADLGRDLPPLLAEPLMAGSGQSPPNPGALYTQLSQRTGIAVELALSLVQTVFGIAGEAADEGTLERARASLPTQWADLLCPIGREPRVEGRHGM